MNDIKYFFYGDEVVEFQRYNIDRNCGEKYVWSFANNDMRGTYCPTYSDTEEFRKCLYDSFEECIKANKKKIKKIYKQRIEKLQKQIDYFNQILEIANEK